MPIFITKIHMRKEVVISTYDSLGNPYYSGGGASAIHEVAKRLGSDYKVTIIAGSFSGARERFQDGVHYRYTGTKFFGPKVGQLFYHLSLPFQVFTNKFDVWIENFTPPFSTSFLPIFTNKPVIGLVHMLSGEDMKRKFKLPFDRIESQGLKLYKNFIVLSKNNKKKILKVNPKANILLTKNGVDLPKRLLPYPKRSKKHILFLGRIEINQKGLDTLLEAYKEVSKVTSLPLVIAGSGDNKELDRLKQLIQKVHIKKKIKLVGRVQGNEKDLILRHTHTMVVPSRYETFSISALESIAYNIPIVISDIPGVKWIPKNASLKFKAGSSKDLSNKIIELLKNENISSSISESQLGLAKTYSWNNIYTDYKSFIEKI